MTVFFPKYINNSDTRDTASVEYSTLWGYIEVYASIITCCLPTLAPLVRVRASSQALPTSGRWRPRFPWRKQSKRKETSHGSFSNADSSTAGVLELRDQRSTVAALEQARVFDVEAQSQRSDVILIQKTFGAQGYASVPLRPVAVGARSSL